MTLTGDEARKQVVRAGERGNLAVVVADILAGLADELKDHRDHRNAFVIMLDKKIEDEIGTLRARVAKLADRVDTVDELTPSFHSIARLEARIEALEATTARQDASEDFTTTSHLGMIKALHKRLAALEQGD